MRRLSTVAVLVFGAVLWSVQPAYANLWDWLQEFSGPGPFHDRYFGTDLMFDFCQAPLGRGPLLTDFNVPTEVNSLGQTVPKPVTCLFVDEHNFANEDKDNFGVANVHVDTYEGGVSARVHRAVSLGLGGGLMRINTPGHTAYKGTLVLPRVVIKPALLYGTDAFWSSHPWWYMVIGSVKYYVKLDVVVGNVKGEDFGLKLGDPNFDFRTRHERLASAGFIIDLGNVIAVAKHH